MLKDIEKENNIKIEKENQNSTVGVVANANEESFSLLVSHYKNEGFAKYEEYKNGNRWFCALQKETVGVFLNYYENIGEATVAEEENCRYFEYEDKSLTEKTSVLLTQLNLYDFGMSYVLRLADGRFIVIDGGWNIERDVDKLYNCLKKQAITENPVIAAWILSHPHSDHYHCFIGFIDKYGDKVTVEKIMYNFPEADDVKHYPDLTYNDSRFAYDTSETANIPLMIERAALTGATVYTPHTGQKYKIGDCELEILASMDDTIYCSSNINAASLIFKMKVAGQVILWATDGAFSVAKIPEKYAEYLKSDILQVPHHGFQSGTAEAEIKAYDYISPQICLLPSSDYNAYTVFCNFRKGTRYLMRDVGIEEMITGEETKTISLPYTASPYAKKVLERKVVDGINANGSQTWFFSNLSTECAEDFLFTVLNTTSVKANLSMDIFFENPKNNIRFVKTQIASGSVQEVCVLENSGEEDKQFNWMTVDKAKIPQNSTFAVRFMSDVPVVVAHKKHTAAYYGANI